MVGYRLPVIGVLLCMLVPVSCTKVPENSATRITATIAASQMPMHWRCGDRISINGAISLPLEDESISSKDKAVFSVVQPPEIPYSAIYPAESFKDANSVFFPSFQKMDENGIPSDLPVMAGSSRTDNVKMYPLCGFLKMSVAGFEDTSTNRQIILKGNKGEAISGEFSISYNSIGRPQICYPTNGVDSIVLSASLGYSDLIFSIPPVSFPQGCYLKMSADNGQEMACSLSTPIVIQEGQVTSLLNVRFNGNGKDEKNVVHTYEDMNSHGNDMNSHASVSARSNLTFIGSSFRRLGQDIIKYDKDNKIGVTYPRFIQTDKGDYLMTFHYGVESSWSGNTVAYLKSGNLLDWSFGDYILRPKSMISEDGHSQIIRCYAGPDMARLDNGNLILVTATRRLTDYQYHPEDSGLAICISNDEGLTWSEPSYVFLGNSWEPDPIVLPNGCIQIYYTDGTYSTDLGVSSTGSSYIYSNDNGLTWLPLHPATNHLHAFRQIRDEKVTPTLFTDQMPAVIVLNGTEKLAAACESNMTKYGVPTQQYMLSMAYSEPNYYWGTEQQDGVIPSNRSNHFTIGAAPQLIQFPSGETVLTFNKSEGGLSSMYFMLGNAEAKEFSSPIKTFPEGKGNGFWGGIYVTGSNVIVMAIGGRDDRTLDIGQMYLNHDIVSSKCPVWLDGNTNEWQGQDALFVGSSTNNQAILRSAYSEHELYLLTEVKGDGDITIDMWLNDRKRTISITSSGDVNTDVPGLSASVRKGITKDGHEGWCGEIALPLSLLGNEVDFPVKLTLSGNGYSDTFNMADGGKDHLPHITIH